MRFGGTVCANVSGLIVGHLDPWQRRDTRTVGLSNWFRVLRLHFSSGFDRVTIDSSPLFLAASDLLPAPDIRQ